MKKIIIIIALLFTASLYPADNENILISEIIADIDNYKNRVVTVNLRLKYIDKIFERIVFYDGENADIEFDISGKEKRKQLAGNLMNIHEGMIYRVKFTAIGAGAIGGLTGDLHGFIPVIFDKIPEDGIN
ncbi:MAG: hypothetical protein CVV49_16280 [Spirochaetae bacterium HGW-Spirochaetae-5]|nr:MAG: hypothetical protein CVV49_16280 [Spirochaetae bacterium HGW-Spirochaetae-5]